MKKLLLILSAGLLAACTTPVQGLYPVSQGGGAAA